MTPSADVAVIGAGILGVFHAHFAAEQGRSVLLLERDDVPAGATTRNFGMLPQTIVSTDGPWATYARDSASIYRSAHEHFGISLREAGSLYLAGTVTERTVLREFADGYGSQYNCHFLEPEVVRTEYPFVEQAYCTGALLFPDDLAVDARHLLPSLLTWLTGSGRVRYVPGATVTTVERRGEGCRVGTPGGTYGAEHVFVCTGAEYSFLFPDHLQASGLQICKLQMMRTVSQPGLIIPHNILSGLSIRRYPAFASCPSYAGLSREAMDATLRRHDIHVLLKGDCDGTVVIGDSHEYRRLDDAARFRDWSNPAIDAAILAYARTMITLPRWERAATWNGYYLIHPQQPVFTLTLHERIHIVTGIGGKGMTTGPGFARQSIASTLG